jgi:hypothetical protein
VQRELKLLHTKEIYTTLIFVNGHGKMTDTPIGEIKFLVDFLNLKPEFMQNKD